MFTGTAKNSEKLNRHRKKKRDGVSDSDDSGDMGSRTRSRDRKYSRGRKKTDSSDEEHGRRKTSRSSRSSRLSDDSDERSSSRHGRRKSRQYDGDDYKSKSRKNHSREQDNKHRTSRRKDKNRSYSSDSSDTDSDSSQNQDQSYHRSRKNNDKSDRKSDRKSALDSASWKRNSSRWRPDRVPHYDEYLFDCNVWLATDEGDGLIERTLKPKSVTTIFKVPSR